MLCPEETDPPLVVDANAVLAGPVAAERLETMGRRQAEIAQSSGGDDTLKSHPRTPLDVRRQSPYVPPLIDLLRVAVAESFHWDRS